MEYLAAIYTQEVIYLNTLGPEKLDPKKTHMKMLFTILLMTFEMHFLERKYQYFD